MYAKIPRELHGAWKGCANHGHVCSVCNEEIDQQAVRYVCNVHIQTLCIDCAREQLGLPEIDTYAGKLTSVEIGDVILSLGNTDMMIHHVILVRGALMNEPLDPRMRNWLEPQPGDQILGLETIESSTGMKGVDTNWASGTHYFMRNIETGDTRIVAHYKEDGADGDFSIFEDPFKFKLLMNPVRSEMNGPGVDKTLFTKVIMEAATESKPWAANARLAAQALFKRYVYEEEYYNTESKRLELLETIRDEWEQYAGVCTSVPIICWQEYFMQKHEDNADEAAQMILKYMPLSATSSIPSELVVSLSKKHWVVQENFEPGGLE